MNVCILASINVPFFAETGGKRRASVWSPSLDIALPGGSHSTHMDEHSTTPDPYDLLTPYGRKQASVSPSSTGGNKQSAIQRAERDKAAREIRAKQVGSYFRIL